VKLLLDEMYPRAIAEELRARGHDAVSVHDAPGAGTTDKAVFDHARSERRAVATENIRDYRPLADAILEAGEPHSGLILTTAKRWPRNDIGAIITALDELLATNPDEPVNEERWL
jgi:predicted nuclease of predicted toxin-antitoxin system